MAGHGGAKAPTFAVPGLVHASTTSLGVNLRPRNNRLDMDLACQKLTDAGHCLGGPPPHSIILGKLQYDVKRASEGVTPSPWRISRTTFCVEMPLSWQGPRTASCSNVASPWPPRGRGASRRHRVPSHGVRVPDPDPVLVPVPGVARAVTQLPLSVAGQEVPGGGEGKGQAATAELAIWHNGGGLVHREAALHDTVRVEPGAVVWGGAEIGAGSVVGSGSVVGPGVRIGLHTRLHFCVSVQKCRIGSGCVLHAGVRIGAEGFGFYIDVTGNMVKKPQPMGVLIGDNVEIGANSCVDRGSWRDTTIGDDTKIDNLVQVGHNVVIGRSCIICGQTGLGGSSTLGDYVVLAGQVGVADHVTITSKVRVGAKSGVSASITKPGDYAGYPAVPAAEWRRQVVLQRQSGRHGHHGDTLHSA